MKRALLLTAALTFPMTATAQNGAAEHAVRSITPDDIRHRIGVIAHDSMQGRNTPSPGLDMTASYIAAEFRRFGLQPGGDEGSYIQRYPITRRKIDLARSHVSVSGGPSWRAGPDMLPHLGGTPAEGITASAVVITGASGDLTSLGDTRLRESIVLLVGSLRSVFNRTLINQIRQRGAAAIILVTTSSDSRWQRSRQSLERSQWQQGWGAFTDTPVLEIRETTVAPVLARHGFDLAERRADRDRFHAQPLPDLTLTVSVIVGNPRATAPNVVGILEGSDPVLKDEYVVFSGHMDHVGIGRPVNGDSIYNGADDDASGTVAIIEAAEAFAMLRPRPKRSMIFLTVSGEEKGMWGSEFFSKNAPVPMPQIVANLNADMVGRNWPDTIVAIGIEHSDLGTTLNRVNERHPELNMTAIDDLWPQERFYFRSDHINFARNGVPILFFFSGTHADYHRPSDHVELIDAEKESRIVKLLFYLGLQIANAPERPQWNQESYDRIVGGKGLRC